MNNFSTKNQMLKKYRICFLTFTLILFSYIMVKMEYSLQKYCTSTRNNFIHFQKLFINNKNQNAILSRNNTPYKLCPENFSSPFNISTQKSRRCSMEAIYEEFSSSTDCRLHEIKNHPLYISTIRNYSVNVPEYCSKYEIHRNPLLEGFTGAKFRYEKINYLVEPKNICEGARISLAIIGVISPWYSFDRRIVVCLVNYLVTIE